MREHQLLCRSGEEEDRISVLPDDLLHDILVRLRSARAAARTSVLSHRWRHLPELVLDVNAADPPAPPPTPASFLDSVDGALAGYRAPTLERLHISLSNDHDIRTLPERVAPWLRFAAERVAGELHLYVPQKKIKCLRPVHGEEAVLHLPHCRGAKWIELFLFAEPWRLRLRPAGMFAELTSLDFHGCRMEGSELSALVSMRCPRLRRLATSVELVANFDISMCSNSLQTLLLFVENTRRLEVIAPSLEVLGVCDTKQADISALKLAEITWRGIAYDPHHHRFSDVGRRLRVLRISVSSAVASLIQEFDEADHLDLNIWIPEGIEGYARFLNETSKLPKCKSFRLLICLGRHGLAPPMLHLLRRCNNIRKLSVQLLDHCSIWRHSCPFSCPCPRLDESCNIDGIALSSLEELELNGFTYSREGLEFVELLSCNAAILKKLVIYYWASAPPLTKEVYEKVRSMYHPNVKVEFYVFLSDGERVRLH